MSFAVCVNATTMNCAICGKPATEWGILGRGRHRICVERGVTQNEFLCGDCYTKKIILRDYSSDEKKRNSAINFFQKKISGKATVLQEIINTWINGEEINYYRNAKEPMYYVEGPKASMFVFDDHLTILSCGLSDDDTLDYVYMYKCNAKVSARKTQEVKRFFMQYRNEYKLSDVEKINADFHTDRVSENNWEQESISISIAVGGYGVLEFGQCQHEYDTKHYKFVFYSHQNQLMEEIYNYIQRQIDETDVKEDVSNSGESQASLELSKDKMSDNTPAIVCSPAEEIKKMKELFDCGILSQEEFDEAKKRLISKL